MSAATAASTIVTFTSNGRVEMTHETCGCVHSATFTSGPEWDGMSSHAITWCAAHVPAAPAPRVRADESWITELLGYEVAGA
jgi:hypothetical protein